MSVVAVVLLSLALIISLIEWKQCQRELERCQRLLEIERKHE